jgi:hypothetical protein
MFTPYHVIMFGILLITGFASIHQISEGEDGIRKKIKQRFQNQNLI